MMNTVRKSKIWVAILSIALVIVLISGIGFTFKDIAYAQQIEEKVANMTENNYQKT